MAKSFVDLPSVLAANIVECWISVKDLVFLDTACCQTAVRAKLVNVLSECNLRLKSSNLNNTDDLVAWSLKRNARVSELFIDEASCLANSFDE